MVYDLNVKIRPESDPVYDLTAIDSRFGNRCMEHQAVPPERSEYIPNEDMLDDALTQSRMREVTIFRHCHLAKYLA